MKKDQVYVPTKMPIEMDEAMRIIAKELGVSRSDVIRFAVKDFLEKYQDQIKVSKLPGPEDADFVPVVEVKDIRYPMRSE